MVEYFFDTYALIEMANGSQSYNKFRDAKGHTTIFNLYELYVQTLKNSGEGLAKKAFDNCKKILIDVKDTHIFLAAAFKTKGKKAHFSYTDALGYAIAEIEGLKFVTGDNEFRNLPNVQFIR